ncbi:MAG: hypothetical protein ACRCR2_05105 [Fusobacteriaceae bacterium]
MDKHTGFYNWKEMFGVTDKHNHQMEITVTHFGGNSRDVADRARATIGLEPGTKEVTNSYMRKLYMCEHSPIRIQQYLIKVTNIPYSIAMHFVRHKFGVEPFISTSRDDRINTDEQPTRDRDLLPVNMELMVNPQSIINISRKRLCHCAHINTVKVWNEIVKVLSQINEPLGMSAVPDCIYRGHCYEHKTCGYHNSEHFKNQLSSYREGINNRKCLNVSRGDIIKVQYKGPRIDPNHYITIGTVHEVNKDYLILKVNGEIVLISGTVIMSHMIIGRDDKLC